MLKLPVKQVRTVQILAVAYSLGEKNAKKINNNIYYESTTAVNSNNVLLRQDCAPSYTVGNTIRRAKSHLYRASDVASKRFKLEFGRLCSVGSPTAASILR